MLEEKVNKNVINEQKMLEGVMQKAIIRNQEVSRMYEKLYEDNVNGKVTDEWFMELSHKYEVERDELKRKILQYKEQPASIGQMRESKEQFLSYVRSLAEMKELTPMILHELIDRIDVSAVEGIGKNRTQRVVIHYRFIGTLDMSKLTRHENVRVDTRQGVAVNYLSSYVTA